MAVATLCKHAPTSDEDPTKCIDLSYEYAVMQTLINSQLKDPDKTPTKREIRARGENTITASYPKPC